MVSNFWFVVVALLLVSSLKSKFYILQNFIVIYDKMVILSITQTVSRAWNNEIIHWDTKTKSEADNATKNKVSNQFEETLSITAHQIIIMNLSKKCINRYQSLLSFFIVHRWYQLNALMNIINIIKQWMMYRLIKQ